MQDLNNKVLQWAEDKGIMNSSTPLNQLTKTFEEVTELVTALVQKNDAEIKDSIGDTNITLIILNQLALLMKSDEALSKSRIFMTINWIVEIFQSICRNKDVSLDIIRAQEMLERVAKENGLTLEECTLSAYEVISKRTGKMVDGVFVKNEPKKTVKKEKEVKSE